jgi:hypothetical protein
MQSAALIVLLLPLSAFLCRKEDVASDAVFKGKLAVSGVCGNLTVSLVDGTLPPSQYELSWQDPVTGVTHPNAFRINNPCTVGFPADMKAGDMFRFSVIAPSAADRNCFLCMAFYPTPAAGVSIRYLGPAN